MWIFWIFNNYFNYILILIFFFVKFKLLSKIIFVILSITRYLVPYFCYTFSREILTFQAFQISFFVTYWIDNSSLLSYRSLIGCVIVFLASHARKRT